MVIQIIHRTHDRLMEQLSDLMHRATCIMFHRCVGPYSVGANWSWWASGDDWQLRRLHYLRNRPRKRLLCSTGDCLSASRVGRACAGAGAACAADVASSRPSVVGEVMGQRRSARGPSRVCVCGRVRSRDTSRLWCALGAARGEGNEAVEGRPGLRCRADGVSAVLLLPLPLLLFEATPPNMSTRKEASSSCPILGLWAWAWAWAWPAFSLMGCRVREWDRRRISAGAEAAV